MKRKLKEKKIEVVYKYMEGLSEEEAQRRVNGAFDILFNEVERRRDDSQKQGEVK